MGDSDVTRDRSLNFQREYLNVGQVIPSNFGENERELTMVSWDEFEIFMPSMK
jgi:hypothetical protein